MEFLIYLHSFGTFRFSSFSIHMHIARNIETLMQVDQFDSLSAVLHIAHFLPPITVALGASQRLFGCRHTRVGLEGSNAISCSFAQIFSS